MGHREQAHLAIVILLFSFLILACTKLTKADVPPANYFSVKLGEEFEIKKGQRAGVAPNLSEESETARFTRRDGFLNRDFGQK